MKRLKEMWTGSTSETRSFEEIYGKDNPIFENVDDVVDPRYAKLFEAVYSRGIDNPNYARLREEKECNKKDCNCDEEEENPPHYAKGGRVPDEDKEEKKIKESINRLYEEEGWDEDDDDEDEDDKKKE